MYHIVTELEARGMPLEIALLPVVESAFEPYAYSRARASGLWQFIPGTGSRYGLKQDWWYDGRRDVVESTRAALDYLQSLHDEFNGDWLLAIAAYNCGEMAVERALGCNRASGKPLDFWSLKLPKETQAYVPKLLAMRRLVADPEAYDIAISPIPEPALLRARRDRWPDRAEGRGRDRRRHRRRALRAQSSLPSMGHRPVGPALSAAPGGRRAGVQPEHLAVVRRPAPALQSTRSSGVTPSPPSPNDSTRRSTSFAR